MVTSTCTGRIHEAEHPELPPLVKPRAGVWVEPSAPTLDTSLSQPTTPFVQSFVSLPGPSLAIRTLCSVLVIITIVPPQLANLVSQRRLPHRPVASTTDSNTSDFLTISDAQITSASDDPVKNYFATLEDEGHSAPASALTSDQPQADESGVQPSRPPIARRLSPAEKFKSVFQLNENRHSFESDASDNTRTNGADGLGHTTTNNGLDGTIDVRSQRDTASSKSRRAVSTPILTSNGERPSTPPNSSVEAPSTLVTPPTPPRTSPTKATSQGLNQSAPTASDSPARPKPKPFSLGVLSGTKPSSNLAGPQLTPPIEETKTPGGSLTSPSTAGFFSSVFNAAQTAATTFSNPFLQGSQGQKQRQTPSKSGEGNTGVVDSPTRSSTASGGVSRDKGALAAVKTHDSPMGASEPSPMTAAFDNSERTPRPSASEFNGDDAASVAQSVAAAYQNPATTSIREAAKSRPKSVASQQSYSNEQSPSRSPAALGEPGDMKRSGSIRSRLSDRRRPRQRGSSVGTSHTLGMNSLAPTGSIASGPGGGHRPTPFAVASSKRNKDFHQLFRSVPEDDYLIEDYSAALQRDILLHGRFYVSEGHVCFSSNILGWVTNLVIAFDEVLSIEKKNTAIVFPNALVIQTHHSKNTFASFVTRDGAFDLLLGIWKASHPNLKVTPTGIFLDGAMEHDKIEKGESTGSEDGTDDGSDDIYDEDAEGEDDLVSMTEMGANGSINGSESGDFQGTVRKASTMPVLSSSPPLNGATTKNADGTEVAAGATAQGADFPGQATHEPTDCTDGATHYERPLIDTTIAAPLGKIYSLWFGPASGAFMKKWLVDDQKSRELSYEDDKFGLDDNHKTFTYSYIKPLNAPVGPRQTKCTVTANLLAFDLDRSVSVDCATQTPDVPSGNIFVTRTRYCLMWGPGNSTRVVATCVIEWSGKSWLKGPIEKGANDGQTQYVKELIAALKAAVTTTRASPTKGGTVRGKKGKRKGREIGDGASIDHDREKAGASKAQVADWGLFEPVRPLLSPLVEFIRPFLAPHVVIAVLALLLVQSWLFPSLFFRSNGLAASPSARLAAYEALWAREEAELWDWLEERTGLDDGLLSAGSERDQKVLLAKKKKKSVLTGGEGMRRREVDEAIRIVDEKMGALKEAVKRKG